MDAAIFDDLVAEHDALDAVLASLDDEQWNAASGAPGWSVADVVLHLAQTEEAVVASVGGVGLRDVLPAGVPAGAPVDDVMAAWVAAERTAPAETFARWRRARAAAVDALRGADPHARLPWAAAPLRPAVMATTRLAEHWAHALDVTAPLRVDYPDTDRLRHVCWLAYRTLPYALAAAGHDAVDVRCDLVAPGGGTWTYGSESAATRVTGNAGEFCRVAARRLAPASSSLFAAGPGGDVVLRVLRTYAL